jgi:hypothetical protein
VIGQTVRLVGPEQRRFACDLIMKAPDRAVVNIRPETRSTMQNSKLWAMLSDVSRAKPEGRDYPSEIWKALFMDAAGFKVTFEPTLDGKGVIPLGFKSSRLTKAEFGDLIEAIYAYGSEHNVKWSEPMTEFERTMQDTGTENGEGYDAD